MDYIIKSVFISFSLVKFNVLRLVVTLTLLAVANAAEINICKNVATYMFLTDIANCSKYVICVNENPISQVCDKQYFFDAKTQSCLPSSASCLECDKDKLSFHKLERTCNKYVLCFAGSKVLKECKDNLQFNAVTNQCDLPQNVDCVDNRCTIMDNPKNITYVRSAAACDKYYICMNGDAISQSCAKGLQFNPACDCCDLAQNVNCTIKASARLLMPSLPTPPEILKGYNCPSTGMHFYPHEQAHKYILCSNGKNLVLSCAEGLLYDQKSQACREPKHIK